MLSKALTGGALAGLAICGALAGSLLLEHAAQVERLEDVLETSTQRFMQHAQREHQAAVAQSIARSTAAGAAESPRVMSQFCLLYTSPSPRDRQKSRMPSSA